MKLLTTTARGSAAVLTGALLMGSLAACGGGAQSANSSVDKSTLTIGVDAGRGLMAIYDGITSIDILRSLRMSIIIGNLTFHSAPNIVSIRISGHRRSLNHILRSPRLQLAPNGIVIRG